MINAPYNLDKLIDDVRGLDMPVDTVKDWMEKNRTNGSFDNIPTGYIDDIDTTLALIAEYKNNTILYHHLAVLLHYYMKELLKIMEERSRI